MSVAAKFYLGACMTWSFLAGVQLAMGEYGLAALNLVVAGLNSIVLSQKVRSP
jgi:hypothetical protein